MERGNYRPLSILSIPSKILVSCVNDAIIDHVLNFDRLVTDSQWAYRKGYSTELLLIHLTETWRDAIDSGLVVGAAFVDFRKDEVAAALNQSLTELYAWCVRNKLTPHPKKSEYMLIHRGSFTGPHPPIYLGNNILERVTQSRY